MLNREWKTTIACAATFFWSISFRTVFFSLLPMIASEFGLSPARAATLVSVFFLGYVVAVWTSGYIPGSRRLVIGIGITMSLAAIVVLGFSRSAPLAFAVGPLGSFGVGLYLPRGVSLISDASSAATQGRNLGIHEAASQLGLMLGPLFVGIVSPYISWRSTYLLWAIVGVVVLVMLKVMIEEIPRPEEVKGLVESGDFSSTCGLDQTNVHRKSHLLTVVGHKMFPWIVIGFITTFVLIMGLVSVFPLLMVSKWGVNPAHAASFVGVTRAGGFFGSILAGRFGDKFGYQNMVFWLMVSSLACVTVISMIGPGLLFTVMFVLMTMVAAGATPLLYSLVARTYDAEIKDKAIGLTSGTASFFSQVVAPAIFGLLMERFGASATFFAVWVYTAMGVLASSVMKLSRSQV